MTTPAEQPNPRLLTYDEEALFARLEQWVLKQQEEAMLKEGPKPNDDAQTRTPGN